MAYELMENTLSSQTIYDGHVVHLERLRVELPNAKTASREVVRHVGGACVLALDDQMRALVVRQYRIALGRVVLEVPAGKLDHVGADPLLAAQRELSEETGYSAKNWRHLTSINPTVGFCDEVIHIFLATGLTAGEQHTDEDEFLEFCFEPFEDLYQKAIRGEIHDAKTVVALLMARALLQPITTA